jgi:hypothetical protein
MPSAYAGVGKIFDKRTGRNYARPRTKAYDYETVNDQESVYLLISLFRWFPDFFYDVFQSPHARYKLALIQRVMLRILARYQNVYITGARGLTKTYCILLSKEHDGIFFPGEIVRYTAPTSK